MALGEPEGLNGRVLLNLEHRKQHTFTRWGQNRRNSSNLAFNLKKFNLKHILEKLKVILDQLYLSQFYSSKYTIIASTSEALLKY
jgi:hypothetical protein